MFIELTDHLRCPADHPEAYMVLLPAVMDGRSVVRGDLGCPICGHASQIEHGEWHVGPAPAYDTSATKLDAEGCATLAGIHGPGGYFVLVGGAANLAPALAAEHPRIGLVTVNPPTGIGSAPWSVLRGALLPLKANSMRGIVLGHGYGEDPAWIREAARVTLPGLRIVGEAAVPPAERITVMASAEGVWVGTKAR